LTQSTEPSATKDDTATPASLRSADRAALGTGTFDLVSVSPSFKVEAHKGHKMEARGSFIKILLTPRSI
jgi:hypothetical protein